MHSRVVRFVLFSLNKSSTWAITMGDDFKMTIDPFFSGSYTSYLSILGRHNCAPCLRTRFRIPLGNYRSEWLLEKFTGRLSRNLISFGVNSVNS